MDQAIVELCRIYNTFLFKQIVYIDITERKYLIYRIYTVRNHCFLHSPLNSIW